jgi:hypothetical protein
VRPLGAIKAQRGVVLVLVLILSVGMALLVMTAARQSQLMVLMTRHDIAQDKALSVTTTALRQLAQAWLNDDPNIVVWPLTALPAAVSAADCDLSGQFSGQWSALPWQPRAGLDTLVVQAPERCQFHPGAFNAQGDSVVADVVIMLARSAEPTPIVQHTLVRRPYRQHFPPAHTDQTVGATRWDEHHGPPWTCPAVYWPGVAGEPVRLGRVCEGQQAWRRLP